MADNYDRFRSFAERYVIERASSFRPGLEQDDAWVAILNAQTAYTQIAIMAKTGNPDTYAQDVVVGQQTAPSVRTLLKGGKI